MDRPVMHTFIIFFYTFTLALTLPSNGSHAAQSSSWERLDNDNGRGAVVCSSDAVNYSCLALRCGKGRGLEFAYFFSGGDIEDGRKVPVFVDNELVETLQIKSIDTYSELVAPYDPVRHGNLLEKLKSGNRVSLQFDAKVTFSLRKSSKSIGNALRMCADEMLPIGNQLISNSGSNPTGEHEGKQDSIELLFNTDLPGFDYASGLNDSNYADVSRDQCSDLCLADIRCQAYTHNGNNDICFLKSGVGNATKFSNATSGVILDRKPRTAIAVNSNTSLWPEYDLSWRKDDTEGSFISRVRAASKPMGVSCTTELPEIWKLQSSLKTTTSKASVDIGKTIDVSWSGGDTDNKLPIYLIVATDSPVRFRGKGFYSLLPQAVAPFGIVEHKSKTRAIVPLFGFGSSRSGTIKIEPIFAGKIKIYSSVIGYQRACENEAVHTLDSIEITALPSALPKVELDDRLVEKLPESYIISPDQSRLIEARDDGTWRLLNASDLAVIVDLPGVNPQFSSTGRFVSIGDYEYKKIYDSLDGKLIIDSSNNDLSWGNKDSFVVFSTDHFGHLRAENTLSSDTGFIGGGQLAPRSSGYGNGVRFDLENGFFVSNAWSTIDISRLGNQGIKKTTPGKRGRQKAMARKNLGHFFLATPIFIPETWNLIGGLKSPQRMKFPNETDAHYQTSIKSPFNGGTTIPTERIKSAKLAQISLGMPSLNTTSFRSVLGGRLTSSQNIHALLSRLNDFSIKTLADNPAEYEEYAKSNLYLSHGTVGKAQVKFGKSVFPKIQKDVPAIVSGIASSDDNWACGGRAFDYAKKYIVAGEPIWLAHLVCADGAVDFYQTEINIIHKSGENGLVKFDLGNPDSSNGVSCDGSLDYCATKSAIYDDRYLIIWSKEARAFALIDLKEMNLLQKKFELPRGHVVHKLVLLEDRKNLIQINSDGTFFIHNIARNNVILSGRVVDDEVVVWTDGFRFDSTTEGAHLVNLKFDGLPGKYTFQQFDSRLRIAGLVTKALAGTTLPPLPKIQVPPSMSGDITIRDNIIVGSLIPNSFGSLYSVRVYQDGTLTDEIKIERNGKRIEITSDRLPGARWISMVAVDEEGLVSLPIGRDLGKGASLPSVHVLSVGIDEYDQANNLDFAGADANTLLDSIGEADGKSIILASRKLLTDRAATPEAVLAAAEELVAKSKPGEQAVFFFAGHGAKGEDGRYYMITSSTDIDNISGTALAWDKLASVLAKSKARMTIFIDACHSGAAGTDFFSTNDEAVSGILKNIPSGLTVFSASKGRELSEEHSSIGGGYFTHAVAQVIAGDRQKYDLNKNGVIEVSELYVGVKTQVVKNTEGRQTPWLARNQMIGDFTLF